MLLPPAARASERPWHACVRGRARRRPLPGGSSHRRPASRASTRARTRSGRRDASRALARVIARQHVWVGPEATCFEVPCEACVARRRTLEARTLTPISVLVAGTLRR